MTPPRSTEELLQRARAHNGPLFVTWKEGESAQAAFAHSGQALERFQPIVRSVASDIYRNTLPSISVRDSFTREDYDYFRQEEGSPKSRREEIRKSMRACRKVGIVKNVVELMAEFVVQGMDVCHPNSRIEKFHKTWWKKVGGLDRSERFASLAFRAGLVAIQRRTARLRPTQVDELKRGLAAADVVLPPRERVPAREIPVSYSFLPPLSVEPVNHELASFVGPEAQTYALKLPPTVLKVIRTPGSAEEAALVARLPPQLVADIRAGAQTIPLDPAKTRLFHYKKDDWEPYGDPMLSGILDDLTVYEKLKLADIAALDGAISQIRVWKLGSLEHRLAPTDAAVSRLADMLMNNVSGGVMDLIWSPDIELIETRAEGYKFLGSAKYEPVLQAIYAGLGIPPSLTGMAGSQGGFTNNFISLKTLVERLEYVRQMLVRFWEAELAAVQEAMGFRLPATLVFDRMTLSDEAAEKALLVQLADRDIISLESIQERFDLTPEIERVRLRREYRMRQNGELPPKVSQWHNPQQDFTFKQAFVSQGKLTPSQVGLDVPEPTPEEKAAQEEAMKAAQQAARQASEAKQPGIPGEGRPRNSKDSGQRKKKTVLPKGQKAVAAQFVSEVALLEETQKSLAEALHPAFLGSLGKGTLRELTSEEARALEDLRFSLLCQLAPGEKVDSTRLEQLLQSPASPTAAQTRVLAASLARYREVYGREPTLERARQIQSAVVCLLRQGEGEKSHV